MISSHQAEVDVVALQILEGLFTSASAALAAAAALGLPGRCAPRGRNGGGVRAARGGLRGAARGGAGGCASLEARSLAGELLDLMAGRPTNTYITSLHFNVCSPTQSFLAGQISDDLPSLAKPPARRAEVPRELRELAAAAAARVLAAPGAAPSGAQLARLSALLEVTLLPRSAGSFSCASVVVR